MKTRVRRDKGAAWTVLAAVLAVPALLCLKWTMDLSGGAPPVTRPSRLLAVTVPAVLGVEPPAEPKAPPADASTIKLQGLIITEDQPRRAIVNGAIVKEGETVDGAVVERIDVGEVTFRIGSGSFIKRLGG